MVAGHHRRRHEAEMTSLHWSLAPPASFIAAHDTAALSQWQAKVDGTVSPSCFCGLEVDESSNLET
jgi:hypothetical protein